MVVMMEAELQEQEFVRSTDLVKISDHFVTLYIAAGLLFFIYERFHPDTI